MSNTIRNPEITNNDDQTVLDAYFAESSRGAEHRTRTAMERWNTLTPDERLHVQLAATVLGQGSVALSESCSQDLLLLDAVNARYTLVA